MKKYISFILILSMLIMFPTVKANAEQDNPAGLSVYGASPRLEEPWGIMFAMLPDENCDLTQADDYGMLILPSAEYESADSKEINSLIDTTGTTTIHKNGIIYSDGYYIGYFNKGIYTYQFDKEYTVIPFVCNNGEYIRGKIHTDSMISILSRTKSNNTLSTDVLAVMDDMSELCNITKICNEEDGITSVNHSDLKSVKRGSSDFENTVTTDMCDKYCAYVGSTPKICEPWGLSFVSSYSNIDELYDFGTVVLEAEVLSDIENPSDFFKNPDVYIFSYRDKTLKTGKNNRYYYSAVEGIINTSSIDKEFYCLPYAVTNDGKYMLLSDLNSGILFKSSLKDAALNAIESGKLSENKIKLFKTMLKYHDDLNKILDNSAAPLTYEISYSNPDDTYMLPETQYKFLNVPLVLNSTPPLRDGYVFLGWTTAENSSNVEYLCGQEYKSNSDVTLYSVWREDDGDFNGGAVKP